MTRHYSEEALVLYRYHEMTDAEADVIQQHLRACEPCRHEYDAIARVLAAVDVPVPEPSPSYERDVWARVQDRLVAEPRGWWQSWRVAAWWPQAAFSAVVAALLVVSFVSLRHQPAGMPDSHGAPDPDAYGAVAAREAAAEADGSAARGRVLLAAVDDHLQRSEFMLTELNNLDARGSVDLSNEQMTAEELVSDNRLYRRTAVDVGDRQMAALLDDLERALLDVAHTPASATPAQLEELRDRLDAQGVLFKVRVAGAGMRERQIAAVLEPGASGPAGL